MGYTDALGRFQTIPRAHGRTHASLPSSGFRANRKGSDPKRNDVRVLAIDDINLRKGDKSTGCTVLIDEETHRVLLIIRGTTKEAAKKAIEMFPSSE